METLGIQKRNGRPQTMRADDPTQQAGQDRQAQPRIVKFGRKLGGLDLD